MLSLCAIICVGSEKNIRGWGGGEREVLKVRLIRNADLPSVGV